MQRIEEKSESGSLRASRAAYIRSIETKLTEKRAALGLVKRKVDKAVAAGRISRSEQLLNAERLADDRLAFAEQMLSGLRTEIGETWEEQRIRSDIAVEEFSNAVKQLVARFT